LKTLILGVKVHILAKENAIF